MSGRGPIAAGLVLYVFKIPEPGVPNSARMLDDTRHRYKKLMSACRFPLAMTLPLLAAMPATAP